jgi:hypothetical protein
MDELVNQVATRTGISQDQARQAVQVVVGFIKDRLPGPVASQVDSALGGQQGRGGPSGIDLGNLGGNIGGMSGDRPGS